jgi:hypothetical protein
MKTGRANLQRVRIMQLSVERWDAEQKGRKQKKENGDVVKE